jgi:hypothetical protein
MVGMIAGVRVQMHAKLHNKGAILHLVAKKKYKVKWQIEYDGKWVEQIAGAKLKCAKDDDPTIAVGIPRVAAFIPLVTDVTEDDKFLPFKGILSACRPLFYSNSEDGKPFAVVGRSQAKTPAKVIPIGLKPTPPMVRTAKAITTAAGLEKKVLFERGHTKKATCEQECQRVSQNTNTLH